MINNFLILAMAFSFFFITDAKSADGYKVFKGEGFSFRYPTSWEEGLPQLDTTKALVRAVVSETGYSASCNVNFSTVRGLEQFTQDQLNKANSRVHDLDYISKTLGNIPSFKLIDYNISTYLSLQPATSVEYTATVGSRNNTTTNRFYTIMTILKPKRYVLTCRGEPINFQLATDAVDLIVGTFHFE